MQVVLPWLTRIARTDLLLAQCWQNLHTHHQVSKGRSSCDGAVTCVCFCAVLCCALIVQCCRPEVVSASPHPAVWCTSTS